MKTQLSRLPGRSIAATPRVWPAASLVATVILSTVGDARAQIRKEDNVEPLNLTTSWVGGVVPGAADVAQWDSQLSSANTSDLGADTTWQGIKILNPVGAVGITGTIPSTLTLGDSGIDMSAATQNLGISSPLVLGSAQTWNITSGRALTISSPGVGAVTGTGPLNIQGRGRVSLGGLGATYTFTGGMSVSRGNGSSDVAGVPGGASLISAANLVFDLAANLPSSNSPPAFNTPALTVAGVTVHTIGGARSSGSGAPAWVQSSGLTVAAGSTNFTQSRGSSARAINQFTSINRSVGGTLNFRDVINTSDGSNNANNGGYRTPNSATVQINGIIPYITFTKSTAASSSATTGTSFFASAGTGNNGTNYAAYTASTPTSLGAATQNATVSSDVLLSGTPAVVNSVRFNDPSTRTITIDTGNTLTIGTGAILVTNNGTADQTITGGTLMGGNPGSGSGYDLIVHQHNTTSSLTINSDIKDNTVTVVVPEMPDEIVVTPTALTKSGAGKLVIGGNATYTGTTFVNSGSLLVDGMLSGTPSIIVDRAGTLGGTGSAVAPVTVNGTLAAGSGIGTLSTGELTFGNNSSLAVEINTASATADKVIVTGGVTTAGNRLNLTLTDLGGDVPLANGTRLTLVDYSTTWPVTDLLTLNGALVADDSTVVLGANTFTVKYNDPAVGTALTLTVTGATASPYDTWIGGFATEIPVLADRQPNADPDHDGHINLVEFALNGNPASASDSGKSVISATDSSDAGTEPDLNLTLAVRNGAVTGAGPDGSITLAADGVIYTIQGSDNLVDWTKAIEEVTPASALVPAPATGWTARTFQVGDSNGLPNSRFIRVKVSN